MPTIAVEDYLKAIYTAGGSEAVSTSVLAERLGVSPPSATAMIKRLAEQGMVTHEPYYGAQLTEAGRFVALRMLRRHRILELYLMHALDFSWDEVHAEAERIEHAASDDLIERMAAILPQSLVDPHGAPIPSMIEIETASFVEGQLPALVDLADGTTGQVARIPDEDPSLLRYLAEKGVAPGDHILVEGHAEFGGAIQLRVGDPVGRKVELSPAAASVVFVHLDAQ